MLGRYRYVRIATSASWHIIPEVWDNLLKANIVFTSDAELATQLGETNIQAIVVVVPGVGGFPKAQLEELCSAILGEASKVVHVWTARDAQDVADRRAL